MTQFPTIDGKRPTAESAITFNRFDAAEPQAKRNGQKAVGGDIVTLQIGSDVYTDSNLGLQRKDDAKKGAEVQNGNPKVKAVNKRPVLHILREGLFKRNDLAMAFGQGSVAAVVVGGVHSLILRSGAPMANFGKLAVLSLLFGLAAKTFDVLEVATRKFDLN
jgi:hypothetical protein